MGAVLQRLKRDAATALYGAPSGRRDEGTFLGRVTGKRLFLLPALLPLLLGASICTLLVAVDPLQIRPWGPAPRLSGYNYPELITPKLVRAATTQAQDVIVIGGSQAMGITPPQLRSAFGQDRVVNLAYSLLRARDAAAVMDAAIRTPGLKRLIVELPFTTMETRKPPAATGLGALSVLSSNWYASPDFGNDMARASLERVRRGTFSLPSWQRQSRDFLGTRTVIDNPPQHRLIEAGFERIPAARFKHGRRLGCGQFPFVREGILPAARQAAARGVTLDLYFPPIPIESYPRAEAENALGADQASFFDRLMSFHRCVVLALHSSAQANAHVHAIDVDRQIVGNLGNYKDTFHIVRPGKFERLLADIRTQRYELTPAGLNAYELALRKAVVAAYAARQKPGRRSP